MRRVIPIAFLIALVLLAARPLWEFPFYYSNDGLLRLAHALSLDQAIHQGIFYPRWLNDLAFGLGYPLFNYYPPLSTYLIEALHLFGFDFADALKAAFGVMIAIAACGAYALGVEIFRDEKNARALGILTTVAYIFFPYLLSDVYTRGVSTEVLGLGLLPWVVWALRRVITTTSISAMLLGAVFFALLILAHILTLSIVAPVLVVYIVLGIASAAKHSLSNLETLTPHVAVPEVRHTHAGVASLHKMFLAMTGRIALTILLGLGLGTFYWLPFIAELSFVRIGHGGVPISAVFPDHFLKLSNLIQPSWFYQYTPAPFALGRVPMLLGALTFVIALIARKSIRARATIIFFSIVAFVGALAMTEPTRDLWLAVPFAIMVQYPWRISVLINLGVAVVISALALVPRQFNLPRRLDADVAQFALSALIAGVLILSALGNLAPQEIFLPDNAPTLAQIARMEASTRFIGATTWGEYLPATFKVANLATYRAPQTGAPRATIALARYDATQREMRVTASEPLSVYLRAFYFPDWRVMIDDQPAAAYASTPMGLLTVDVPAGDHRVAFVQGDTPPRQIGILLSIASVVALMGLTALAFYRRESDSHAVLVVCALVLILTAPIALTAFTSSPPALQSTRVAVTPALEMIGLRVDGARLQSDVWRVPEPAQSLHLRVYWHITQVTPEKSLTWRLVDDAGKTWATREQLPRYGTGYAASWIANEIVEDLYDLPIAAIVPGRFRLQVAYGDAPEFVTVGVIEFARGFTESSAPPRITNQVNARVGKTIRLLGYDAPAQLIPGSRFPLTLFWQADQNVNDDFTVFVQLLDSDGNAIVKNDSVPGGGLGSTFLWLPNETITDRRALNLPNDLTPGLYTLVAGMYHYPELTRLPIFNASGEPLPDDIAELGQFKVAMNARDARPARSLDISLGAAIRLTGYDLRVANKQVHLQLYWRADAHVSAAYKVFVHLLDAQGNLVAQIDRLPVEGKYPTPLWDTGETIPDAYTLPLDNLAAGRYTVVVGMYDPNTGERLRAMDSNGYELPEYRVELETFDLQP